MKILLLGSDGMLGHVVKIYFQEKEYDIVSLTRRNTSSKYYYDADKDTGAIEKILDENKPDVVINCIGILNKVAEDNKPLAVKLNSYLPHYLDSLSDKYSFKLVHISTDCVFDGVDGNYSEVSKPNADNFYGKSKALGEVINNRNVTLRTSIVGPDINRNGIGLFKWFMDQDGEVGGYTKVLWTGVTTIWLARCIELALLNDLTGLQHCVNNETIDKYSLLLLFKKYFEKDIKIIRNNEVVSKKTLVRTDSSYDFQIPSYEDMICDMKEWVFDHPDMYGDLIEQVARKSK